MNRSEELIGARLRTPTPPRTPPAPWISIVVPALNEEENVEALVRRVGDVLGPITGSYEIVFVSDGSTDRTAEIVKCLHAGDPRVKLLHLSRRFGHQNAILAGLDHAQGRVVITMDADLQHPPEAIPEMLARWEEGADVVHAVRRSTRQSGPLIGQCKRLGYGVLRRLCEVDIIPQSADFRLYDRRAVAAMRSLREHSRFNRGLARWIGFRQAVVTIDEHKRRAGVAKYSFLKLLRLLTDGIFSLSSRPLQYMGVAGLGLSVMSIGYMLVVLVGHALNLPGYRAIGGWASLIAVVLCMSGIQLMGLWLMGQYLGRTYDEVKRRPPYIIADAAGFDGCPDAAADSEPRRIPRRTAAAPARLRVAPSERELEVCERT